MANQYEVLGKAPGVEDLQKLSGSNLHLQIKNLNAGSHKITWEGSDMSGALVPSGLYLYQISTETKFVIGKMTLLK